MPDVQASFDLAGWVVGTRCDVTFLQGQRLKWGVALPAGLSAHAQRAHQPFQLRGWDAELMGAKQGF